MSDVRQKTAQTFIGGMNKDADESLLPSNQYIDAHNIRLISDKDTNQSGSLSNMLGNVESVPASDLRTSEVLSYSAEALNIDWATSINHIDVTLSWGTYLTTYNYTGLIKNSYIYQRLADSINVDSNLNTKIIAVANNIELLIYSTNPLYYNTLSTITLSAIGTTVYGSLIQTILVHSYNELRIIGSAQNRDETLLITCNRDNYESNGQIWLLTFTDTVTPPSASLTLLYNNKMNLSTSYPIRDMKCNIDSDKCKKIYFTDHNNFFRHFDYQREDHFATSVSNLDIIGDVNFIKPKLDNVFNGGGLKNGTYQYAYKLFNTFGSETLFSPASDMIPLTDSNYFAQSDNTFLGGVKTESAGKSIAILIEEVDRRYDNIEVVSLYYEDLNGTPEINVIYRGQIKSNNETILDNGLTTLGTYSYQEFTSLGGILFTCKTFDTKNNLMLPCNIELEEFDVDFDARAYRWALPGVGWTSKIKDRYGYDHTISYNGFTYDGTTDQVPKEHDAINSNTSLYKYQLGSYNLGGTGPNVSYKIKTVSLKIGDIIDPNDNKLDFFAKAEMQDWTSILGDDFVDNHSGLTNYANVFNASQLVGFQRDETYRIGMVFYSKKGMRSPTKWIGDIRMPSAHDVQHQYGDATYTWADGTSVFRNFPTCYCDYSDVNTPRYALVLGLDISVNIPDDIKDKISGYEIVRVKREYKDRTIVTQGIMLPTSLGSSPSSSEYYIGAHGIGNPSTWNIPDWAEAFGTGTTYNTLNTIRLASPEICIDDKFEYSQGDGLQFLGIAENYMHGSVGTFNDVINPIDIDFGMGSTGTTTIKDVAKVYPGYDPVTFNGDNGVTTVRNVWQNTNGTTDPWIDSPTGRANGGTCLFVSTLSAIPFWIATSYETYQVPVCNYVRPSIKQYGGNTYEDRQNNTYISTGAFRSITERNISTPANLKVFGGDIYITVFDYASLVWNFGVGLGNDSRSQIVYMPLESHINCDYRTTKSFRKNKTKYLQEGPVSAIDSNIPFNYVQDYYLYTYNPVYSNQNIGHKYLTDLPLSQNIVKYDTRIYSSNRKIVGELKDSWTKYLSANHIDLNAYCGQITKAINFKNAYYVFQNNGIGIASIDDRSVVPDQTGLGVVLGTGGILTRFDYISMSIGTKNQFSVLATDDNLYFFDSADKQIKMLGEGTASLTEIKGFRSYMYNNVTSAVITNDNPHSGNGISCYFDNNYGEAVFTFMNHTKVGGHVNFTLAFNESAKCFSSFYDFASPIYIKPWSKVLSVNRDWFSGADSIYMHNQGNYAEFYGTKYASTIHILANQNYAYTKVFDSIEVLFNCDNDDVNQLEEFFDSIRCYNKSQNTDWHNLIWYPSTSTGKQINYTRRENSYTLALPRNIVDADITTNPDIFDATHLTNASRLYRERLRSKVLHIELQYNNTTNHKIYFPIIIVNYRASIR